MGLADGTAVGPAEGLAVGKSPRIGLGPIMTLKLQFVVHPLSVQISVHQKGG